VAGDATKNAIGASGSAQAGNIFPKSGESSTTGQQWSQVSGDATETAIGASGSAQESGAAVAERQHGYAAHFQKVGTISPKSGGSSTTGQQWSQVSGDATDTAIGVSGSAEAGKGLPKSGGSSTTGQQWSQVSGDATDAAVGVSGSAEAL